MKNTLGKSVKKIFKYTNDSILFLRSDPVRLLRILN
jgi:hypothetical protein